MLQVLETIGELVLRASRAKVHGPVTPVGRTRAYELRGKGEGDVFLVHGLGASSSGYVRLARRLREHVGRVVLVDLPGHGRSERPASGLDLDSLGDGVRATFRALIRLGEPATLVGNSLGGAVSLGFALEAPELVRSVVLLSPGGAPLSDEELASLRRRFAIRTRADARRFVEELMHAPPWTMRLLEHALVAELGREEVQGFLASVRAESFFTAERVRGLSVPATLVWGRSDRILPASGLEFYRANLPSEHTVVLEPDDVGHSPQLERPGLVLRTIVETHERSRGRARRAS